MHKYLQMFGLTLAFLVAPHLAFAETLTGLKATPNEPALLIFTWNGATTETINQSDGYAIQWSEKQTDIQNNKYARQFIKFSAGHTLSVRLGSFEKNKKYYFRIYTYQIDGRNKILTNGSKILKWEMNGSYTVTSEEIDAHDPVIVDNSKNDEDDTPAFNFGEIRTLAFDNFTDFSWSRSAQMIASDYDGFYITIAKNPDMTDVVKSFKTDTKTNNTRVKGLAPSTQYYAKGAFYKDTNQRLKTFGEGTIKSFKTIAAIDRSVSTSVTRNLAKIEKKVYHTVQVGVADDVTTTATTTTTSTTTKTSSTSIAKRIAEIKAQISKLQAELNRLQGKKTTTTKTKTYTSTRKKSVRDLIRERLAARRSR